MHNTILNELLKPFQYLFEVLDGLDFCEVFCFLYGSFKITTSAEFLNHIIIIGSLDDIDKTNDRFVF